jgi:hypothetical protein
MTRYRRTKAEHLDWLKTPEGQEWASQPAVIARHMRSMANKAEANLYKTLWLARRWEEEARSLRREADQLSPATPQDTEAEYLSKHRKCLAFPDCTTDPSRCKRNQPFFGELDSPTEDEEPGHAVQL